MNNIIDKLLLAGGTFITDVYLRQIGFTYNVCEPLTKNKIRIQKFKETGDSSYIYRNDLNNPCS